MTHSPVIRTPDQRLRVFVSSTLKELEEERSAVRQAILNLRLTPVLFELGARPHPPRDLYRSYLAQSDIFVGIYWERYGWIAPGETVSGLEDEYLLSGRIPKLIYIKLSDERDPRLAELLDRIKGDDQVSFKPFSTGAELQALVEDDLALMLTERFELAKTPAATPEEESLAAKNVIPIQPTAFVGRHKEEGFVRELVERDDVRLVTLTGPGGIGKSRLAFEVIRQVAERYEDGIRLVFLSTITDPQLALPTIGQSLGVRESSERSIVENVKGYLRDRHLLLLLDNFEHVMGAAPSISELLAACPRLEILITSRAALRVRGEHEVGVPPLSVPDLDDFSLEAVEQDESVRLFVERAHAASSSFTLTPANAKAIAEICVRLDGLPLAIELAAARTRLLPPEAMLSRLSNRLELLTGGPRDLPARQRTLRAALDWDYDLLSVEEQIVFRRLAVFAGGFTLAAAEEVVAIDADSSVYVLDSIESLVTKSLLRPMESDHGEPRFGMLKTIREYATEKLLESGEMDLARSRHLNFFLALAEIAASLLRGAEQIKWLQTLEKEHDNLRAALRTAAGSGKAEAELRLAGALARFWEARSYLSQGQRWLEEALSRSAGAPPELRARCLDGAGILARGQGEYKRAAALLEECVSLRRELDDDAALATSLKNLGNVSSARGDYESARRLYEECLDIRRKRNDRRGMAEPINNLGVLAGYQQEWDEAAVLYDEALALFRERDDTQGVARALLNLGEVRMEQGDFDRAADVIKESIVLNREIGSSWDICDLLEEIAYVAGGKGRPEDGAKLFGAAHALRELLGAPIPPTEVPAYERWLGTVREALDADAFERAWGEGLAMDEDEAVAFALAQ